MSKWRRRDESPNWQWTSLAWWVTYQSYETTENRKKVANTYRVLRSYTRLPSHKKKLEFIAKYKTFKKRNRQNSWKKLLKKLSSKNRRAGERIALTQEKYDTLYSKEPYYQWEDPWNWD